MWCGQDDLPIGRNREIVSLSLPWAALSISGIAETVLLPRARAKGAHFPQHHGLHLTQPQAQLSVSDQTHRSVQLLYCSVDPVTACSPLGSGCHLYQAHPGLSQVTTCRVTGPHVALIKKPDSLRLNLSFSLCRQHCKTRSPKRSLKFLKYVVVVELCRCTCCT